MGKAGYDILRTSCRRCTGHSFFAFVHRALSWRTTAVLQVVTSDSMGGQSMSVERTDESALEQLWSFVCAWC